MRARAGFIIILVTLVVFGVTTRVCDAQSQGLRKNFYKSSCRIAEQRVKEMVTARVQTNPSLGAKLLRVHYHDCFVRGCDGSILLDTVVGGNQSEKEARPNLSLSGFDVIEDIKTQLEKECKGVVSCADIASLAARDAVSVPLKKDMWDVLTGRRDGNISLASEVTGNLPSPFSDFATLLAIFKKKNLNVNDLVSLSGGGHTIGVAHCGAFSRRLFNFTGKGDADPTLNATYAEDLKLKCPNPANPATTVDMDPGSSTSFDSHYFQMLFQNQGLFQSDAALLTNPGSKKIAEKFKVQSDFFSEFAKSMKKMGEIEVLTGRAGTIRTKCSKVNINA